MEYIFQLAEIHYCLHDFVQYYIKAIFTIIILNRDLRFYCRMKNINMVLSWTFKNLFGHNYACVRKTLWKAFLLLHIKTNIHGIISEWINDSKIIGYINPLVDSNLRQVDVTYSIIKLPLCIGIHFSRSGLLQIVCNVTLKNIISIVLYTLIFRLWSSKIEWKYPKY